MTDFASCCVLSYNRPTLLRDSLSSLVAHAGAPFELIVHDDGSSDESGLRSYLSELVAAGAISTLILNPVGHNQGQGVALNRMFHMAKGDPIIKLDHDLLYGPGWLAGVQELLRTNRDASEPDRPPGGVIEPRIGLLGLLKYEHEPVDWRKTKLEQFTGWSSHTHILGSGFALTREAWNDLQPFAEHSPAFAEDADMQRRVYESMGPTWSSQGSYVNGLSDHDFVANVGMGYGPSTVNVSPGNVQTIHEEPVIHGR